MSIAGGGNFTLLETFYAANGTLQITGNGNAAIGSQYISRDLNLGGNGNILINYTDNGTARLREATLVERGRALGPDRAGHRDSEAKRWVPEATFNRGP
jgi:hypothetical protein